MTNSLQPAKVEFASAPFLPLDVSTSKAGVNRYYTLPGARPEHKFGWEHLLILIIIGQGGGDIA